MNFIVFKYSHDLLVETAKYLQAKTKIRPIVGIICGSGLGPLAESIECAETIPYREIPNFPVSTVQGHKGQLVLGNLSGVPVLAMQGRFHYYEGYPMWKLCLPIRVMKLIGINILIATNAAGGVNTSLKKGDLVIIKDHINLPGLAGITPLNGPNDDKFGPRFPSLNMAYDPGYRKIAKEVSLELKIESIVREGIYACIGGPAFETIAELNFMKLLGVDCVGMSTAPEIMVARHCGMKCFGMSLVTDECVFSYDSTYEPDHDEILVVARNRQGIICKFIAALVNRFALGPSKCG